MRHGPPGTEELAEEQATSAAAAFRPLDAEPAAPRLASATRPLTLSSPSTLALIAANLLPLLGAALWGWSLGDVMVLYWAETAIIGLFNVVKISIIGRWAALLAVPFFIGHFGAFMAVHFLFINMFFLDGLQSGGDRSLAEVLRMFRDLAPALGALLVSHGFSFVHNFLGKQEYRSRSVNEQMSEPYSRVIFMHLVIIFGGGIAMAMGEPTLVIMAVIAVKIVMDVRAHLREHRPAVQADVEP